MARRVARAAACALTAAAARAQDGQVKNVVHVELRLVDFTVMVMLTDGSFTDDATVHQRVKVLVVPSLTAQEEADTSPMRGQVSPDVFGGAIDLTGLSDGEDADDAVHGACGAQRGVGRAAARARSVESSR